MARELFVVIVGCGRLGSHVANRLSASGHSVVAIDLQQSTFAALSPEFGGFRLEGDATELSVLTLARTERADVFIATTSDDNVNLMAAQIAQTFFDVPRVVARVFDPARESLYRELGVTPICPTTLAVDALLAFVPEVVEGGIDT